MRNSGWLLMTGLAVALIPDAVRGDDPPPPVAVTTSLPDRSPTATGYQPAAHLPLTQPRVLWTFRSDGGDPGVPRTVSLSDTTSADGVVYVGDTFGGLFALLSTSGERLWKTDLKTRLGTPSVDRHRVYVTSQEGVFALDRERGELQWQFEIPHGAGESTPLSTGEALFVSGYDGQAYGLEAATGIKVWSHDLVEDARPLAGEFENARARFQDIRARPNGAAFDDSLFLQAVFDQSRVVAIDCATGQRKWSFQAAGWTADGPTIDGDRVYIGSQDKHLYCLDRATGNVLWKFESPTWLASRVAVHGDRVYLPVHRGRLFQLDAKTGDVLWEFQPADEAERRGHIYSFPIVTNEAVYFAAGNGRVYAVNTYDGRLRWSLEASPGSEIYSDLSTDGSRLFITTRPRDKTGENAVVAIGLPEARD